MELITRPHLIPLYITFIYVTLIRFDFKDDFLNWERLLHLNAESCVVNNGVSSEYFKLNRGTSEGDPLAAYIFILVMQIVSSIIKHDSNHEGIPINNEQIKMVLFADDESTFFLRNWDSLERLQRHLQTISEYTSLVVN